MRETESIQCPFCGQDCEVPVEVSTRFQRFTTDCEVCCRPFEVIAECEDGEVVSIDVQAG
jgi:transcription elongation factor Elf1